MQKYKKKRFETTTVFRYIILLTFAALTLNVANMDRKMDIFFKSERPKAISFLKRCFSAFSNDDIEDIVQDSSLILYSNITTGRYEEQDASLSTYFMSICKFQASNKARKRTFTDPLDEQTTFEDETGFGSFNESNVDFLIGMSSDKDSILDSMEEMVKSLPTPCDSILWKFYWMKCSMKEIAAWEGYKNEDVAKSKKSKCLSKFKDRVTQICNKNKWTLTD